MAVIYCKFAVYFLLDGFYKQITPMDCKPYLVRYAEAEKDSRTANMICEVIVLIFSGENEEIVKDVISSFLGRKYAGLILKKAQLTRDEQIEKIALMDTGVEDTGILDSLLNTDLGRWKTMNSSKLWLVHPKKYEFVYCRIYQTD